MQREMFWGDNYQMKNTAKEGHWDTFQTKGNGCGVVRRQVLTVGPFLAQRTEKQYISLLNKNTEYRSKVSSSLLN